MEVEQGSVCPAPSAERIAWLERVFRVQLPEDYREFLESLNGAIPRTNVFRMGRLELVVERFLPLFDDPNANGDLGWMDITVVQTQLCERLTGNYDLVGADMVPFAALFGGDFACLDYRKGPTAPSVCLWEHEQSREFHPSLRGLCATFGDFVAALGV